MSTRTGASGPTISRTFTGRGTIRIGIPRWRKATSCRSAVHPTIEGWEYGQKDLPHHRSCKRSKVQTRLLCQPAHGYVSPRRAPAWGTPYSMSDEAFCYTSSPTFHTGPPFLQCLGGHFCHRNFRPTCKIDTPLPVAVRSMEGLGAYWPNIQNLPVLLPVELVHHTVASK
jgi:hypothetical protein